MGGYVHVSKDATSLHIVSQLSCQISQRTEGERDQVTYSSLTVQLLAFALNMQALILRAVRAPAANLWLWEVHATDSEIGRWTVQDEA